jgi:hypothetical protein
VSTFGSGIPVGGEPDEVLTKQTASDYDVVWEAPPTPVAVPALKPYLDVASLKMYLRIAQTDTIDDALLASVVSAVEALQRQRLMDKTFAEDANGDTQVPEDVYQAALMRGARLYMRRASPEGLVGVGDLGVARVPVYDRDIDALEAPHRNVVLA